MQELDNLIAQYQKRVLTLTEEISKNPYVVRVARLEVKKSCYRTFIVELERLKTQLNEESK